MRKILSFMLAFLMAVALVPSQALAESVEESIVVQRVGDEDPVDSAAGESLDSPAEALTDSNAEPQGVLVEAQDDATPKFHVQTAQIQGINGTTLASGPNYKHVPTTYYFDLGKDDYPRPYGYNGIVLANEGASYWQASGIYYPGDRIVFIPKVVNDSTSVYKGMPGIGLKNGKTNEWCSGVKPEDKIGPFRVKSTETVGNWHSYTYITEIVVEDAPVMLQLGSGVPGADSGPDEYGHATATWNGYSLFYVELPKYHPIEYHYRYHDGNQWVEIPAEDLAKAEYYNNKPANPEVVWAEDLSVCWVPYVTYGTQWDSYQEGDVFTISRPYIEGYHYYDMQIYMDGNLPGRFNPWIMENNSDEQSYTTRFRYNGDWDFNWTFTNQKEGSEADPIVVNINYGRLSDAPSTITVDANGGLINGRSEWMFNYKHYNEDGYFIEFYPQDHLPTHDGYEFDGWYADAACTQIISPAANNGVDLDGGKMYESDVRGYVKAYAKRAHDDDGANHIRIYAKWVPEGAKHVSELEVSGITEKTWTGEEQTQSPVIKDGNKTLVEGADYRILGYENNVNVGTAKMRIQGIGSYKGYRVETFSIARKPVDISFDLEYTTTTYNGEWQKPTVKNFTCSEPGLAYNDANFYTSYSNNRDASTASTKAKVTVSVRGSNYTGSATETFTIKSRKITPTVVLGFTKTTYTGEAQYPSVTVKDGDAVISSSYYTVDVTNNVEVGTATDTVTLKGNYEGVGKATFQIVPATKTLSVAVDETDYTEDKRVYDEWYKEPALVVKSGSTVLAKDTDYRVIYKDNYYPGTATVTVTGVNAYAGYTGSTTFKIQKPNIGTGDYTGKVSARRYTGEAVEPKPSLYVQLAGMRWSTTLYEGEDYVVTSYANNVEVGTATMTIKGMGYFTGTATLSFVIEKREGERTDISGARVTINETYDYTGKPIRPYPTVEMPGMYYGYYSLRRGTDYDVSYENNVKVGTAYLVITGADDYVGTVRVPFQIVDPEAKLVDVSAAEVTVAAATYTGKALTPAPTVKIGGKTLAKGTDYTVSYANNVKAGTNTATLTITGVKSAGYTGTKTVKFSIGRASISKASVAAVATQAYTGKALTPAPKLTFGGATLAKGTDYTLAYANNTKVGTATITITGKGNFKGSKAVTFKIAKLAVALTQTSYEYTGKAITPGVTVKMGSTTLKKNTHYTVTYASGRKAVGAYSVKVVLKGGYAGQKTVSFTIVPVGTAISKLSATSKGFKATWGKQATQTTGYQVQCATDAKFSAGLKTVTVKGTGTVSTKVTELTGKKKYYVRVRTYKTVGKVDYYSAWSAAKAVTTKA